MYKGFIRPLLFLFPAEKAHHLATRILKFPLVSWLMATIYGYENKKLERHYFGLKFKNPIGLAAGFDKNAEFIDAFANIGFSFIEIGTLTPKAQSGNKRPRLFRLKKDEAIINRMGFNNEGVEKAILRLRRRKSDVIIGGNIGKNKSTSNADAKKDYISCFNVLFDYVDYFTINISSPNTKNLRDLQEKESLNELLSSIQTAKMKKNTAKPIFLKIAPDLTESQLDDILEVVQKNNIDGLIVSNTTISREGLKTNPKKIKAIGDGGLSGKVLCHKSTEMIRYITKKTKASLFIIAVGGIHSAESALEKFEAGASLIQIYSAFIYEGPKLLKEIKKALLKN